MATEVSSQPQQGESAFPRPSSLYQPQLYNESLLDASSFSPYPTLNGYRSDPFGLNAFLLHPEDRAWDYLAPAPAEEYGPDKAAKEISMAPQKGLKRMSSALSLRRGSPLAQTPLMPPPESPQLGRRRSKSLDTTAGRQIKNDVKEVNVVESDEKSKTVARRGFSRLFGRRKSISGVTSPSTDSLSAVSPITRPDSPLILTPSSSVSDVSTTTSKRSSLVKSDSSHSSTASEEIRTPAASPIMQRTTASPKADEFGRSKPADATLRKKSLMSWISVKGKSTSRAALPSSSASSSSTISSSSASSSSSSKPSSSSSNPSRPVTPTITVEPPSRITPSPERLAHAWVGDAIRRASWRKFSQLRRPSPHPLAQHLRRQTTKIPNEVISSFEAGQRIYPKSVNHMAADGLSPDHHGLLCLLGVKVIFDKLDKGEIPYGTLSKKAINIPESRKDKGKRSMKNFINRAPFEERYEVFYSDGSWSPVSIARPGFGVWDLDFSKYIIALASTGDNTDQLASWPVMPRPSFLAIDELAGNDADKVINPDNVVGEVLNSAIELRKEVEQLEERPAVNERKESSISISSQSSDASNSNVSSEDTLVTPAEDLLREVPEIKIDLDLSEYVAFKQLVNEPLIVPPSRTSSKVIEKTGIVSSFRKSTIQTWDDSDDEGEEEEDIEARIAPEDAQMKASLVLLNTRRPSLPNLIGHRPISQSIEAASSRPRRSVINVTRIASQSATDLSRLRSPAADQRQQRSAMEEVAKARERRQMLLSGEVDRRVEAEKRRSQITKPSASNRSSDCLADGSDEIHHRSKSNLDSKAVGISGARRYHSFYEIPSTSSPQSQIERSWSPSFPHSQQQSPVFYPQPLPQYPFAMHHPQIIYPYAHPGLPQSASFMTVSHPGLPASRSNMSISKVKKQRSSFVQ